MFCNVSDVQNLLQVEIPSEKISSLERAIEEATSAIQNYTHQTISYVADDVLVLDGRGGTRIFLPELPVVSITGVTENDVELTVSTQYKLGQYGVLHRIGNQWASGIQNIEITYSHGYQTIPDDIVSVCTRASARIYQAGLLASELGGNPAIEGESIGDYSVSYAGAYGATSSDGLMGVSSPRMLLLSEKDILNKYRVVN
jgi:hypothetical protein